MAKETMETVAFRAQGAQVKWMRRRAKELGMDRSELLRSLVTAGMLRTKEEAGAAANVAEIERRLLDVGDLRTGRLAQSGVLNADGKVVR